MILRSKVGMTVRISVAVGSLFFLLLSLNGVGAYKYPLVIFLLVIIHELIIHFGLEKVLPRKQLPVTPQEAYDTLPMNERLWYEESKSGYEFVMKCLRQESVRQFIKKIGLVKNEFERFDCKKEDVLTKAVELASDSSNVYITGIDIVASYLQLVEHQSHTLQQNDIDYQNFLSLYFWMREHYQVDTLSHNSIVYSGAGVFDFFVYGWNSTVKIYADSLTNRVASQHTIPIITGREEIYTQMLTGLSKQINNSILLVGPSGVGKTSLVEYFALSSYNATVPAPLNRIIVYELYVDRLLSGITKQGELEERLEYLFTEILYSGNVIVFIPNIENIFGAGGYGFDASGILYDYLKKGLIQIIGTTTTQAYSEYFKGKETIASLIEAITIDEPSEDIVVRMLLERVGNTEHLRNVSIAYSAVVQSVELAKNFTPEKKLPGSAFDLLENTISYSLMESNTTVTGDQVKQFVQSKRHILLDEPDQDEKQLLMRLEGEIHKRMIGQEDAVGAVASAMRRLRSGFVNEKRPISSFLFLGPTGVGKTEMAKALATLYFQNEENMLRYDMSEFKNDDGLKRLLGGSPGEPYIPHTLVEEIQKKPFSVVLLDEFEKANPHIHDLFLQVFDDGRLTGNSGDTVSFNQSIIIATSNAGSEFVRECIEKRVDDKSMHEGLIEYLLQTGQFRPELINRFDAVIVFKPLTPLHIKQIAGQILQKTLKNLEKREYFISFDESVTDYIMKEGYNEQFGARNIRRFIQDHVEEQISKWILDDTLVKNQPVTLQVDPSGAFALR